MVRPRNTRTLLRGVKRPSPAALGRSPDDALAGFRWVLARHSGTTSGMDEPNVLDKAARMTGRGGPEDYGSPDDDSVPSLPGDEDEHGLGSGELDIEDSSPV